MLPVHVLKIAWEVALVQAAIHLCVIWLLQKMVHVCPRSFSQAGKAGDLFSKAAHSRLWFDMSWLRD